MTPGPADFTTAHMSDASSMYSDDASAIIPQHCEHSRDRSNVPGVAYEYEICLIHTFTTEEAVDSTVSQHQTSAEAKERRRRSAAIARAETKLMAWVEADAHTVDRQSKWPDVDFLNDEHQYPKSGAVEAIGSRPPTPLRHPPRPSSTTTKSSENTRGATETEHGAYKISPLSSLSLGDSDPVHPGSQLLLQSPDTTVAGGGHSLHFRTTAGECSAPPVEEGWAGQNLSAPQNDGCPPHSQASADRGIQHSPPFGSFQPCHSRGSVSAIYTMPTLSRDQTCSSRSTMHSTPPRSTGGVVSFTGNVYGLGDHSLGYSSGRFVTNISYDEISNKAPKKFSMRRIFCM